MKCFEIHKPTNVSSIVFAEDFVKQDLMDYATGLATNHLLLHGEFGTGKSTLAYAIAEQRNGVSGTLILNAKSDELNQNMMLNTINFARINQTSPAIVIDEVDVLSKRQQDTLCGLMDKYKQLNAMFVFTTNYLKKVDDAVVSRCCEYHIKCLTPTQVFPTAKQILLAEGVSIKNDAWLLAQLKLAVPKTSKAGSWRDYGKVLDRVIRHKGTTIIKPPPKLRVV